MGLLKDAGNGVLDKWKTQPIGGEIRPEVWGQIFDAQPKHRQAQDFTECVQKTHATWVMDSGMFEKKQSADRIQRATWQVRKMGYDFHIQTGLIVRKSNGDDDTRLTVVNNGVAPFYADWPLELVALSADGSVLKTYPVDWKLTGILPAPAPQAWTSTISAEGISPRKYGTELTSRRATHSNLVNAIHTPKC